MLWTIDCDVFFNMYLRLCVKPLREKIKIRKNINISRHLFGTVHISF